EQGDLVGGRLDLAPLLRRVPGRGDHERDAPLHTHRQDGHRPLRLREVNDRVESLPDRQLGADRDADGADAGEVARVAAELRVAGRLQGGAEGQVLVLAGQSHQALPHPAGGAIDADRHLHEYTSIALMISSRSLGTWTGPFANVARRTPRWPSTCSN